MTKLLLAEEVYAIAGAAMEVQSVLRHGFLEAVYKEALEIEFRARGIPYAREVPLVIKYKGQPLKKEYFADFVCYGKIVLEVKATEKLTDKDEAQLLNYLSATGFQVGVLTNFGHCGKLEWKRMVW